MELYTSIHLRCPHLSAQAFVKALCDTHSIDYQPYLLRQFNICYDLYLQVKNHVRSRVMLALDRGGNWRLRNACPACTYKLEGEDELIFSMLIAMDGNESLKRVLRREALVDDEGNPLYTNVELQDGREVAGDYYLNRERADFWVKDRISNMLPSLHLQEDEENPCASRWTNMVNEMTARTWAVFDETGIFLALCRHGFALVVADMVRSGEMYVLHLDYFTPC